MKRAKLALICWLLATVTTLWLPSAQAQSSAPADLGTWVAGYQDDFEGTTLNANWGVYGDTVYSVSGGVLHVGTASGDPNHLLLQIAGYDATTQEVLARVRMLDFGSGDSPRAGLGVGIDPGSSQGVNYLFRNNNSEGQQGYHLAFLDDLQAWGPGQSFAWQTSVWYWMRLRQELNASGGSYDVFGKIWPDDGLTAEPATWQLNWDYVPNYSTRSGYAGITASSSSGTIDYEVDYVLIKAAGLPSVFVAPSSATPIPAGIATQPQNAQVNEGESTAFTVTATGNPFPAIQWYKNNQIVAAGTNATLAIEAVSYADNGAQFKAVVSNYVSNQLYAVTSSVATLTVVPDKTAPKLLSAASAGLSQVVVSFSERMAIATATNLAHYLLTNDTGISVSIQSAILDATQTNVALVVPPLIDGANYTLVASDLADQSAAGNVIAPNSWAQFRASDYAFVAIGNPTPAGEQVPVGNGYNISGGGAAIGGASDQFQFSYQAQSGNFDVQVRLDLLSLADAWTEAGLMAREDLTDGGRFVAALATPSISGAFFKFREKTNGTASITGQFPANYPNTWLRLKRSGNILVGYASFDGRSWTQLGTVTVALAQKLYLGFAVCSHNSSQLATAAFRDYSTTTSTALAGVRTTEPLGMSSRRTSLAFSEIMYHPTNASLEFVELFNASGEPQDLSGYRLGGDADYVFPAGSRIAAGQFLVLAKSPTDVQTAYHLANVLGPYNGSLPNSSGTVRLYNQSGGLFLEVNYGSTPPWPVAPDGSGHSLVLVRPSYGENNPSAWAASSVVGGSPGRLNPIITDPLSGVVINEFLANTTDGQFIELHNRNSQPLDISGCGLSDDAKTNKYVLPAGSIIPARGSFAVPEDVLGFHLDAENGVIWLRNPANNQVLDVARYGAQMPGVSFGRCPDGLPTWRPLASLTAGATNSEAWLSPIVINEIMYNPASLDDNGQFVELYNRGTTPVDLMGWRFTAGIDFAFTSSLVVPADGYVVVARNASYLRSHNANLNASNLAGDFAGKLSHGGECLALAKPALEVKQNAQGLWVTNTIYPVVNEVTYGTGGRWGEWSDGGGSSLELVNPLADNSLAPNWADSDETKKAPWCVLYSTGTIDNGSTTADSLQVLLEDKGECLIDNVKVLTPAGANLVANGTFESGAKGWTAEGTESGSSRETTEGHASNNSYHIRAVEKGDNQINRVYTPLSSSLKSGTTNVTIQVAARWLKGNPNLLLRLRGNWLECAGTMTLPENPGTPGARNSRYLTSAPPAIDQVQHSPVLPAAGEAITVKARVSRNGAQLASVKLYYRLDPSESLINAPMKDDGMGNDETAGDGIYAATIPGQASGTLVAFFVLASTAQGAFATFPSDAPSRECLARVGETTPTGNLPIYRVWVTQSKINSWTYGYPLNNTAYDSTFVLGDQRVIYNVQARYKGSPYISPGYCGPTCGICGYTIAFPADDPILGDNEIVLDWPGGHGHESTGIQEQMGYWIADRMKLPFSHRYTIRFHINGVTDNDRYTMYEAIMQPDGSYVKEWSPKDTGGQLFKIERAFEFGNYYNRLADPQPRLQKYTTTGGAKKLEKYRWTWMHRSTGQRNDYTNLFALVDAVNSPQPEPYTSDVLALVDIEQWMRVFAFEHIIVNFDAYGHEIGKNMYAYLPENGKWQLYPFDLDWLMLAAASRGGSYSARSASLWNCEDPIITRMYNNPTFRRAYWRAVKDAVDGPLNPDVCNPVMDAKSASLFANGINWCDGQRLTSPTAVKTWFSQRRTYLQTQLASVNADFAIASVEVANQAAVITGTAPITVGTISFNGVEWPVTWTSVNGWTVTVPLAPGTNQFVVLGLDTQGQTLAGASNVVSATLTLPPVSPVGRIVINEIMFRPTVLGGSYIELANNSSTAAFDLSGWRLDGMAYTFPAGTLLNPGALLVLAADRTTFAITYGSTNLVCDTFGGDLPTAGGTLALVQPGSDGDADLVVAKVRYSAALPWPAAANGTGSSLQLIDPAQDNWRVGNWAASYPPVSLSPYAANTTLATLPVFPALWINEVQPDNVSGITNSAGQHAAWVEIYNPTTTTISLAGLYLAGQYNNLREWPFPAGATVAPGERKVIFCDGQTTLSTLQELHASFVLTSGTGSVALSRLYNGTAQVLDYLDYANLAVGLSYGSYPEGQSFDRQEFANDTPGTANDGVNLPANAFVRYNLPGSVYTQNFDGLPAAGAASINADNPVTIDGSTIWLDNPYSFSEPVMETDRGGLGVPNLAGWHGLGALEAKFGASSGDQTTGGQISFGLPGDSNRALGLLATSSTGPTAIGVRFINDSAETLSLISAQVTGELWRQSDKPKSLQCFYYVDLTGTNHFTTNVTAWLPNLDVRFSTNASASGGVAVDGTAQQTTLSVANLAITNWPPGTALWLGWIMPDATGRAQGLAIDNLSFMAKGGLYEAIQLSIQAASEGFTISWPTLANSRYQLEFNDDLSTADWSPASGIVTGTGQMVSVLDNRFLVSHKYYRVRLVP